MNEQSMLLLQIQGQSKAARDVIALSQLINQVWICCTTLVCTIPCPGLQINSCLERVAVVHTYLRCLVCCVAYKHDGTMHITSRLTQLLNDSS